MFSGYNPVYFKLFIWTLSAVICGIAGALYVPQVGIINPSEMSPANSIEIAIWTAVGGRGTLIGPVIGAAAVNLGKSWFTQAFPEYWLYLLGLLFILVTLYLPRGIAGLWARKRCTCISRARREQRKSATRHDRSKETGISDGHLVPPGVDISHGAILYLDSISVSFDGFKALNDLSLTVDAGELRCVIGPNGAGKTTMMDVITGKTRPDTGTAYFGQTST